MKKRVFGLLALATCLMLSSCGNMDSATSGEEISGNTSNITIDSDNITSEFKLIDENNNEINSNNGIYTITEGGSYTVSGKLTNGQIYVAASGLDVEIVFEGLSISNSNISPIYVNDCDDVTLKVKNNYTNYIYDYRTTDYSNSNSTDGTSAIYVNNGDLKINGKGTLSILSKANSGIHGKDNVTVKNVTMLIKAQNNGIKGNDKVTVEENPTLGIVAGNNGIITSNSEIGNNGAQHGYVYINGGNITINSYGDGIDAAYAVEFNTSTDSDNNTYTPVVDIYTNKYSSYSTTSLTSYTENNTYAINMGMMPGPGGGFDGGGMTGGQSAEKADDSAKGIKANESITINAGEIFTYTYDDGLHTNNDKLDTNVTANANIIINGGNLKMKASDDAIHADGTLTINGGTIYVSESHEGLEGNKIVINGGDTTVFGNDDGINASTSIVITGGRVDVTVSPSGDKDGIDSNGTISITGGIVIARGPNSEMAAPIDADGTIRITGGVVIIIGYVTRNVTTSLNVTQSSNGLSSGNHTVTIGSSSITYNNNTSYSGKTTVLTSSSATIN